MSILVRIFPWVHIKASNHRLRLWRMDDTGILKKIYKFIYIFIILLTVIEVTENLQKCCHKFFYNMGKQQRISFFLIQEKALPHSGESLVIRKNLDTENKRSARPQIRHRIAGYKTNCQKHGFFCKNYRSIS